ncbi:3-oxoacyl-[acyl-carrier protein] reductase [Shimia isoporae]|uniref:3-oxoacyl-[acyl-carrier protein] reductase n=1 Tax=Shimia isoporae TaxID=647720 RepID=A0A4R1NKV6_9RHOB|nr:SDR family oxidoreductase [Shimia isoporae]TCL08299.1 3-oxoacyl-[acyl-carrier protein] reductase [Shimia isoporae]
MTEIAIVTGGTRGIGRRTSIMLAQKGYAVIATYRSGTETAQSLEVESDGAISTQIVDGSDSDAVLEFAETVLKSATPKILVNNAGVTGDDLFLNSNAEKIGRIMQVNFGGVLNYCSAFVPAMTAARQGDIVNTSSVAATKVKEGNAAYGCAKAAIDRLTLGIAQETARFGVRVNAVAPGFVETDMFDSFAGVNAKAIMRAIPGRRITQPDEVAHMIVALATRQISTTGTILRVGNGENI